IAKAKKRFKLVADTPVFSCYEAGRDGFWLHRYLTTRGIVKVRHVNRSKGLLASQGLALATVDKRLPEWLETARLWDGTALGVHLRGRLLRGYERWQFVHRQVGEFSITQAVARSCITSTRSTKKRRYRFFVFLHLLFCHNSLQDKDARSTSQ